MKRKRRSRRLIDDLVRDGYVDRSIVVLLEDTFETLGEQWTAPTAELDGGQKYAVLSLLGAVLSPTRREARKHQGRAQWIALDSWYRSKHLGHMPRKTMEKEWKLGATALKTAINIGRPQADLMRVIWSHVPKGERIPQVEALIAKAKRELGGSLRSGR